jgi:hypothetical protein
MKWFEQVNDGMVRPVTPAEVQGARIQSQSPAGSVSTNKQKSGWLARTADGRMFDEAHHDWAVVPKDLLLDVRMVLSNTTIGIPKISLFTKYFYIKRADGQYCGAGALLQSGVAIYLVSLTKREGVIFTLDSIEAIERLPSIAGIEYVDPEKIDTTLVVSLPSKTIIIPKRNESNYFFQYKDGAIHLNVPIPSLFGQAIGMITNSIGNCVVLYYDQDNDVCLVSADNIFNMKISINEQGFPTGIFTNPITGVTV